MWDLHTHILPAVDDGARDMDETLAMIEQACNQGVRGICATPHVMQKMDQAFDDLLVARFNEVQEAVDKRGFPVRLVLGSEIYIRGDLDRLLHYRSITLNNTGQYLLLEFSLYDVPAQVERLITRLVAVGVTPIIAHPERNATIIRNPLRARAMVEAGALLQLNGGSLIGEFGRGVKTVAEQFLVQGLAFFIGSDAHNTESRSINLKAARDAAAHIVGEGMAALLVDTYPKRVVMGESMACQVPVTRSGDWHSSASAVAGSKGPGRELLRRFWQRLTPGGA